jgi:hypothetical protein
MPSGNTEICAQTAFQPMIVLPKKRSIFPVFRNPLFFSCLDPPVVTAGVRPVVH